MSAPVLTQLEIGELAEKARRRVALETSSRKWGDLWPIVEPFTNRPGGRSANDIKDAVQFLIDEGKIDESDRQAAEIAFRRERSKREAA